MVCSLSANSFCHFVSLRSKCKYKVAWSIGSYFEQRCHNDIQRFRKSLWKIQRKKQGCPYWNHIFRDFLLFFTVFSDTVAITIKYLRDVYTCYLIIRKIFISREVMKGETPLGSIEFTGMSTEAA